MTVFSKLKRTQEQCRAMELKKSEIGMPPAIDFWKPTTKKEEATESDYKSKREAYASITIPIYVDGDPIGKTSSTYERHVKIFRGGSAEEFCGHLYQVEELYRRLGYGTYWQQKKKKTYKKDDGTEEEKEVTYHFDWNGKTVAPRHHDEHTWTHKTALLISTLGGNALQHFEQSLQKYDGTTKPDPNPPANDPNPPEILLTKGEVYDLARNDLARLYFPHPTEAAKTQKRYLREGGLTFCGECSSPMDFWERLTYLSQLPPFFPWVTKANGVEIRPTPTNQR